jgi:hypothetical protein
LTLPFDGLGAASDLAVVKCAEEPATKMKLRWPAEWWKMASKKADDGIHLDVAEPCWEMHGPEAFGELLNALAGWIPQDAILYFEGGSPDAEISTFLAAHAVPEESHVNLGTLWPRPKVFHVPARRAILVELAAIMEHHAGPELAIHFHIYRNGSVLLEWYDAFWLPMFLSGAIPEEDVKVFAAKLGRSFRMIVDPSTPTKAVTYTRTPRDKQEGKR